MNAAQIHLALTHLPVFGFLLFTPVFLYGWMKKNGLLIRLSSLFFVLLAISAVVVFNTGEGAEEIVEEIGGISHRIIHEHEEAAEISLWLFAISGTLAALVLALRLEPPKRSSRILLPVLGILLIATCISAVYTAKEGGKIRHPETENPTAMPAQERESEQH